MGQYETAPETCTSGASMFAYPSETGAPPPSSDAADGNSILTYNYHRLVTAVYHRERLFLMAILAAGIGLRLAGWLTVTTRTTEMQRVAAALATRGEFADAFRAGSGPTAHVSPGMPLIMASVYRIFGVATPAAEVALAVVACLLVAGSIFFTYAVFAELGASRRVRTTALLIAALVPLEFDIEVRVMKAWEGPLAVLGVTGLLLLLVRLDRRDDLHPANLIGPIFAAAVLSLVSPPAALAVLGGIALLVIRRLPPRHWPATAILTIAICVGVTLPWALRNQAVMGRMIWTRSNADMELALAYNDTIVDAADPRAAYVARVDQISPATEDGANLRRMQAAGGELAYNDQLGAATRAWMAAHPWSVARLVPRHVGQIVVPPKWFMNPWGNVGRSHEIIRVVLGLTTILSIAGFPLLLRRDRRFVYVAIAIFALSLPYVVAQPILRYRYMIATLTLFCAVETIFALERSVRYRFGR